MPKIVHIPEFDRNYVRDCILDSTVKLYVSDHRKSRGDVIDILESYGIYRRHVTFLYQLESPRFWYVQFREEEEARRCASFRELTHNGVDFPVHMLNSHMITLRLHWIPTYIDPKWVSDLCSEWGEVYNVKRPYFHGELSSVFEVELEVTLAQEQEIPYLCIQPDGRRILVVMPGRRPLCLKCQEVGHMRRECPNQAVRMGQKKRQEPRQTRGEGQTTAASVPDSYANVCANRRTVEMEEEEGDAPVVGEQVNIDTPPAEQAQAPVTVQQSTPWGDSEPGAVADSDSSIPCGQTVIAKLPMTDSQSSLSDILVVPVDSSLAEKTHEQESSQISETTVTVQQSTPNADIDPDKVADSGSSIACGQTVFVVAPLSMDPQPSSSSCDVTPEQPIPPQRHSRIKRRAEEDDVCTEVFTKSTRWDLEDDNTDDPRSPNTVLLDARHDYTPDSIDVD